jgi:hypothetical protein
MSVTSLVGGLVMLLGTVFCCCCFLILLLWFLTGSMLLYGWSLRYPRRCCSAKRPQRRQAENRTRNLPFG